MPSLQTCRRDIPAFFYDFENGYFLRVGCLFGSVTHYYHSSILFSMGAYLTCVLSSVRRNITGTVYLLVRLLLLCTGFPFGHDTDYAHGFFVQIRVNTTKHFRIGDATVFSTTNCTVTRPCVPFFMAASGYLMFFSNIPSVLTFLRRGIRACVLLPRKYHSHRGRV